jgi:hypothetical protein
MPAFSPQSYCAAQRDCLLKIRRPPSRVANVCVATLDARKRGIRHGTHPHDATPAAPNPIERQRRPDGDVVPGESHGKRTEDARNDPETEPGAKDGQPRRHPPQI